MREKDYSRYSTAFLETIAFLTVGHMSRVEKILELIRAEYSLTKSETEVLKGIILGMDTKQLSKLRNVCTETTRTHIKNVLSKCNCQNQRQLIILYHHAHDNEVNKFNKTISEKNLGDED